MDTLKEQENIQESIPNPIKLSIFLNGKFIVPITVYASFDNIQPIDLS